MTDPIRRYAGRPIMPAATAPRSHFFDGIPKGETDPIQMRWDRDMNCFLTDNFACINELACWLKEYSIFDDAHDGAVDPVHQKLRKAVEKRESACLWTPADTISFVPRLAAAKSANLPGTEDAKK